MIRLYTFGADGWCESIILMRDEDEAMFYVDGTNPSSYITSELDIPINTARLVDGTLVIQARPRLLDHQRVYVRGERNSRLLSSDWTQLPDVPLATKEAWATYRQALRDITDQPDPFNVTWPIAPA